MISLFGQRTYSYKTIIIAACNSIVVAKAAYSRLIKFGCCEETNGVAYLQLSVVVAAMKYRRENVERLGNWRVNERAV